MRQGLLLSCLISLLVAPPNEGAETVPVEHGPRDLEMATIVGRAINRNVYLQLSDRFEKQYPGYSLNVQGYDDTTFRHSIERLIATQRVQLGYTPTGTRLCVLAEQGLVHPLERISVSTHFDPRHLEGVSCNGRIYGVPLLHYFWGFFYNKALFASLHIEEPTTWPAFLAALQTLSENSKIPVLIGTKNHWPVMSWFSYLNLRLHGIDFHRAIARGQIPFTDSRVADTLRYLAKVINAGGFIDGAQHQMWNETLALLYRGHAGMILSGSFLINQLPPDVADGIGFFPFPLIRDDLPVYEESPLDAVFISAPGHNPTLEQAVVGFFGDPTFQGWFSQQMGFIPANKQAQVSGKALFAEGRAMLERAQAYTQYFDRDAHPVLATQVPEVISRFLVHADTDATLVALEKIRENALTENTSDGNKQVPDAPVVSGHKRPD